MKLVARNKPIIPMIVIEFMFYLSASSALDWLTRLESHAHPTKSGTFV
jgi:hypothetical protein